MSPVRILLIIAVAGVSILGCIAPVEHKITSEFPAPVLYAVGTPQAVDGRARFREIFCQLLVLDPEYQGQSGACENYLWRLNDEPLSGEFPGTLPSKSMRYRVLVVPGILNDCFASIALPFEDAIGSLSDQGFNIDEMIVSGRSSSDANAEFIAEMIGNLKLGEDEKLVLIGHSKGAVDILHFLVEYPKVSRRVAAVVSVAGAINGSPLAVKIADIYTNLTGFILAGRCGAGDEGAINSMQPAVRMSWLAANPLPESVRYFSVAAFTERDHINTLLKTGYDHLRIYGPRNDGLLLISDQIIPGGTLLGYANADHWSAVLPLENENLLISETVQAPQEYPRKVMLQAILAYVTEALKRPQEQY
jgi:pimeloyl-ACP methyl ester carboxylesterase